MYKSKVQEMDELEKLRKSGFRFNPPEFRGMEDRCQLMMQAAMAQHYIGVLLSFPDDESDLFKFIQHNGMFVAFLTSYGKCFREARGGAKVDERQVFQRQEASRIVHSRIMSLCHKYAAHNDRFDVFEGVLAVKEEADAYVTTTRLKVRFPIGEYEDFFDTTKILSDFIITDFEKNLQKIGNRLGKRVVIQRRRGDD